MAILGQARLNVGRLNAFRLNCVSPSVFITIGGTRRETKVRLDSLQIVDSLSAQHAARTATLRVWGFTPTVNQDVKIYVGALDVAALVFGGIIQTLDQVYEDAQANVAFDLNCVDYLPLLNRRLVYKTYTNVSATLIAQDLIATYTSGFSSAQVQAGLPALSLTCDGIYVGDALTQLQTLIPNASWLVDPSKTVYFFTTDPRPAPATVTEANTTMDSPLVATTDGSQVRTRMHVIGASTPTISAVVPGQTVLPLASAAIFSPMGGQAHIGSPAQVVTYSAANTAQSGALVGPGVTPTSGMSLTQSNGLGIESGVHGYAYTWVTAAGETLPGPLNSVTCGPLPTPTAVLTIGFVPHGIPTIANGTTIEYALAFCPFTGLGTVGSAVGPITLVTATGASGYHTVSYTVTADMVGYQTLILRRDNGGAWYALSNGEWTLSDVGVFALRLNDFAASATVYGFAYTVNANLNQVALAGVALGPATVTSRKIYRTAAGGTQLKGLSTIADNTTTAPGTDSAADATLGANAPTSDTSGLALATGQVIAGSTTLLLTSTSPFRSSGGWAIVAGQPPVLYTGISGNSLTGIPASGPGSLTATVTYGTTVTAEPGSLTGIPASGAGAIVAPIAIGQAVDLFVQVEDLVAEAAIAASEGGDGIHEFKITDGSLTSLTAAVAAASAELALFKAVETKLSPFSTRDRNILAGTPIPVAFGSPTNVSGTFTAQRVTIAGVGIPANQETNKSAPGGSAGPFTFPLRTVEASTTALTLTDLLARLVQLPRR